MQAVLVMFRSDGERRSFSLTRDVTVIGRREDCDLRIPLGEVSRKHCRIVHEDGVMRLEDLGSSNGTYHNGVRVEKEALLQPGDSIQIGPVVFVLQVDGVPADEDLNPIIADAAVGAAGQAVDDATEVTQQYGYADDAGHPAETVDTIDTLDTISVLPDDMGHGEAEPSQSDAARHSGHDDLEALDLDDDNGPSGGEHLNLLDLDAPPEGEGQLHIDDLDQADSNPSRQRPQ